MKVVLVSCFVLSLAGLSQELPQSCRSVPQQQCRNVQETVYETETSQQCSKKPVQDCRQQQETTYEEVTRQQCQDVQDKQCRTVRKPVQVNEHCTC